MFTLYIFNPLILYCCARGNIVQSSTPFTVPFSFPRPRVTTLSVFKAKYYEACEVLRSPQLENDHLRHIYFYIYAVPV